jgi:hypothetical protein
MAAEKNTRVCGFIGSQIVEILLWLLATSPKWFLGVIESKVGDARNAEMRLKNADNHDAMQSIMSLRFVNALQTLPAVFALL